MFHLYQRINYLLTQAVKRILQTTRKRWAAFIAGFVFAIACFLSINVMSKHFSTSQYCGSRCHEMDTAYKSWQLSEHYVNDSGVVVECVECHLPPKDKYFTHLAAKAYLGSRDIFKHYFGGSYNPEDARQKVLDEMPNERCLGCHSNLSAKPSSPAAKIAHEAVLNPAEELKARCLDCHQQLH
jgi:sulfatase modifying factor 1